MSMRCLRCNRLLKRESASGYGTTCERYVLGTKPRRIKREDKRSADERQTELPLEAAP